MSAPTGTRRLRLAICAAALGVVLLALAFASDAQGKVVSLYVYDGTYPASSFNGSDAVGGGAFGNPQQIGIDQGNGNIYVGDNGLIYKVDSAGNSQPFSAIAPTTVVSAESGSLGAVKVDNSSEPTAGRIYGWNENSPVSAYQPTGTAVGGNFPLSGVGDNCGGDVAPNGFLWITAYSGGIQEYTSAGASSTAGPAEGFIAANGTCQFAIDSEENFWTVEWAGGITRKYDKAGVLQDESQPGGLPEGILEQGQGEPSIAIDRSTDTIFLDHGNYVNQYDSSGALIGTFGGAEASKSFPGLAGSRGIAVNEATHEVYASNGNAGTVDPFTQTGPITIPDATTEAPSVTPTTATLKGTVDPDTANGGGPITHCNFEWGETSSYGNVAPCDQATPIGSSTQVTATIGGLTTGTTYHFRVTAASANDVQSNGGDRTLQPAGPPIISEESVSEVNTDGARISAKINPAGSTTSYRIEYGTTTAYGASQPVPDAVLPKNLGVQSFSFALSGLTAGTEYHFRVVATNLNDSVEGSDHTFTTFPTNPSKPDTCANAQVRQQTGASLLLDCRAYELASAVNQGGYDVQSDLIPGQVILAPQPGAPDSVLYSVHFGKIPNTGDPTNLGLDPYVATRGAAGWSTAYVGIPANGTPSDAPFGSPLADSSGGLRTFAFAGSTLCDPCFADQSKGIPVRMPDGSIVQGMRGSLDPGPAAEPAGHIGKALSADGNHLVFGSTSKFEPDAAASPSLTIYDRNLATGTTHVVSKTPAGATMTGAGIGELDISDDGSRIVIGQLVSTDAAGNSHWHLYMNVGDSSQTIDLTPGTTSGALYGGMSADGTEVYFTSADKLAADADTSADVYRADVGTSSATLTRVSTGSGSGDTNSCNPVAGKEGPHWNDVNGAANCNAVVLAGGAGVASGDGTVYFLSPEKLDGQGTAGGANLFVVLPGGAPHFVATVEAIGNLVRDAVADNELHDYADFQVTSNGDRAVFASSLPLTAFDNQGHSEVYRFDALADVVGTELQCVSCASTGAAATGEATLSGGLNIADNGTVFFTSSEPLVLRDTNGKKDVYEWRGTQQLISTGTSDFDSGLLSASADGVNVYFFTRATLVPQDRNGNLIKVYDARAGGGFLALPALPLCAASDECHGAGTVAAPPPSLGSIEGTGGNVKHKKKKCQKGKVKKHGKCVKKKSKKKKGGSR